MVFYFRKGTKSSYEIRNCFFVDQQGLNLGPPDYESVALTN